MISAQSKHWQSRVNQFSHEIKSTPKGKIVFLGNSITEGFDLTAAFPKTRPINRGIISDHLDGVLDRLDSSVIVLQPSQLFILIGINDIGRGDTDSLINSRYRTLLSRLHLDIESTRTYLVSILPTSVKWSNCPKEKIEQITEQIIDDGGPEGLLIGITDDVPEFRWKESFTAIMDAIDRKFDIKY